MTRFAVAAGVLVLGLTLWFARDAFVNAPNDAGSEHDGRVDHLRLERAPQLEGTGPAPGSPPAEQNLDAGDLDDPARSAALTLARAARTATVASTSAKVRFRGKAIVDLRPPQPAAHITLVQGDVTYTFPTAADGTFDYEVPAGRYDLLLAGPYYMKIFPNVLIDGAPQNVPRLKTPRHGSFSVIFIGPEGRLPDIRVFSRRQGPFAERFEAERVSDRYGVAKFLERPAGRYDIHAETEDGIRVALPPIEAGEGFGNTHTVRFPGRARLRGVVRSGPEGPPLDRVPLTLEVKPKDSIGTLIQTFTSGPDGRFDLHVPRGEVVRLSADVPGYAPYPSAQQLETVRNELESIAEGQEGILDVILLGGTTIEGRTTNQAEHPVPNLAFRLHRVGSPEWAVDVQSDAEGRFTIPHLAGGSYGAEVLTPGIAFATGDVPQLEVDDAGGTSDWSIMVAADRLIRGKVTGNNGKPVGGARVWLVDGEERLPLPNSTKSPQLTVLSETFTAADGRFVLPGRADYQGLVARAQIGERVAVPTWVVPPDPDGFAPDPLARIPPASAPRGAAPQGARASRRS